MNTAWPLVGRDEELAFIDGRLGDPAGGGVVLAGEAGCGKTRLALEVLERARERGMATILVTADRSTAGVPLGAFAHLLNAEDLAGEHRLRLLVQARRALEDLRGRERLLLVVDDAQHLDPTSAAFVHQVAVSFASVVATLRSHEPVPERVLALWKEGLAERIELQPLSWPDVQELLARVLRGPVEGRTLHRLWAASRGNVLYLRELVLGGRESGALREETGVWAWEGPLVAPRLVDLVGSRLGTLPDPERDALGVLALGEPMDPDFLETLVGAAVIRSLERRRLVTSHEMRGRPQVRVAHPLYREVLTAQLPPMHARATKRRLIDALRDHPSTLAPALAIKLALWSVELGDQTDPDGLLHAARHAADPALAERLARAALEGGGPRASAALACYLYLQGRGDEAERVFSELQPDGRASIATASEVGFRAANLFFVLGHTGRSLEVLEAAERSGPDAPAAAEYRSRRAQIHAFAGATTEAVELATHVLADADAPHSSSTRAAWIAAVGLALQGRSEASASIVDEALPALDPVDDADLLSIGNLLAARFLSSWFAGRLDEADAVARSGYELLETHPRSEMHGIAALGVARVALVRGRVQDAAGRFEEAAVILREYDTTGFVTFALSGLAQARALCGEADAALAAVDEAERRQLAVHVFDADLELARAWAAAAAGAVDEAIVLAVAGADVARDMGQHASETGALHDAIRLGGGDGVAERLVDRALTVEGELAAARVDHAMGLLESDPEAIERASQRFEAAGALLPAAECAAHAAGMHQDGRRGRRARAATARARVLAGACQGAHTPPLWHADAATRLTRREREVGRLAATGLSNQEIAHRLVVSLRTVENHLHQVYAKLGVSGRGELGGSLDLPSADLSGAPRT